MPDNIDSFSETTIPTDEEAETNKQTITVEWGGPKSELGHFFRTVFNTLPQEDKSKLIQKIKALTPVYHYIGEPGEVIHDLGHDGRGFEDFSHTIPLNISQSIHGEIIHPDIRFDDLASQIANLMNRFIETRDQNHIPEFYEGQHASLRKQAQALRMLGETARDRTATLTLRRETNGNYSLLNIVNKLRDEI